MEEPLEKDLMTGRFTARLDPDGTLTLTRIVTIPVARWTVKIPLTITLPAQAVRALHNLLRRKAVREVTGYRHEN